jgi:hypothetical protein
MHHHLLTYLLVSLVIAIVVMLYADHSASLLQALSDLAARLLEGANTSRAFSLEADLTYNFKHHDIQISIKKPKAR